MVDQTLTLKLSIFQDTLASFLKSQVKNLYGKSFAKTTGQAINNEYPVGVNHQPKDKYVTQNNSEYHKDNFRTLKKELDPAEVKDINDAFNFHDAE